MPVKGIKIRGKDGIRRLVGYQWGNSGKIYLIRSFGKKKAYELAGRQGRAIKASQARRLIIR